MLSLIRAASNAGASSKPLHRTLRPHGGSQVSSTSHSGDDSALCATSQDRAQQFHMIMTIQGTNLAAAALFRPAPLNCAQVTAYFEPHSCSTGSDHQACTPEARNRCVSSSKAIMGCKLSNGTRSEPCASAADANQAAASSLHHRLLCGRQKASSRQNL